ncbi:MAG: cation:dicarboxylase symporter family transporter [Bacteroidota bacterium]
MKLYTKITIGLVAGIVFGWVLNIWYDAEPFQNADKDGNGFLTIPEIVAGGEGLEQYKNPKEILKVDINKDGGTDWEEILLADHKKRLSDLTVIFEIADVDKNGELSIYEARSKGGDIAQYGEPGTFAATDTSGNGGLDMRELKLHAFNSTTPILSQNFKSADKDSDGLMSQNEAIIAGGTFPKFVDKVKFADADLDQNGSLSLEEIAWSGIDKMRFVDASMFGRADQNGDMLLTKNEEKAISGMQRFTVYTDPIGKIFIRLVKMVVVPLILASLILGAANLGDVRKLGSMGLKAFGFFMLTTAVAVSIGVAAANIFRPGDGLPEDKKTELVNQFQKKTTAKVERATSDNRGEFEKIVDLFVEMVPTNPVKSLASGDMLAIIFFALFVGLCVTMIPGKKAEAFVKTMEGLNEIVLKMVMLAMETAPYGVFALIVGVVADMGIDIMLPLMKYGGVVVGALLLHVAITHMSFVSFYLKLNPLQYLKAIKEALLLGFSTSSSSATLPISMNVANKNLGISKEVSSFVLPLGATINMDGTALYQGVAAIFIAQVYGIELLFSDQIIMVLTATLASVGAAGVPGAGMITLAVVLGTAGIPLEGIALIFGLDRLLDMFRTTINITGDITCAAVLAKSEGETVEIKEDQDMIPG